MIRYYLTLKRFVGVKRGLIFHERPPVIQTLFVLMTVNVTYVCITDRKSERDEIYTVKMLIDDEKRRKKNI